MIRTPMQAELTAQETVLLTKFRALSPQARRLFVDGLWNVHQRECPAPAGLERAQVFKLVTRRGGS